MAPVSRWLGLFVFAAVAAAQQPASLVVLVQSEVRAVDFASGVVGKVTGEAPRQPPPLQRRWHGMDYASIPTKAVWSPDGKRVAHVLQTFDTPVANGEIAITDEDGGNLVVVTEDGGCKKDPWWSPDGKRLFFSRKARTERAPGLCVFHCDGGTTAKLGNVQLQLSPRPVLLADGFLLAIHKHPYVYPDGIRHAAPKYHHDLVVDPGVAGREPEIVLRDVPIPIAMEVSANGLVVWLASEQQLLRIDRRSKQITHRWHIAELGDAEWPVRFGQLAVHPDGDLAALTFWGLGWKQGNEGGRDVVALVEVPGAKSPADATPKRRNVVVGNDPRLLGFVAPPASVPASATGDADKDETPKD
ncbi:MAG: PD40 domain-containing protein [Planctomycetes bacterium]|nr:PD40 domain-containing protein [Planctomycetota bacterium]